MKEFYLHYNLLLVQGAERVLSELANYLLIVNKSLDVHLIILVGGEKFYT